MPHLLTDHPRIADSGFTGALPAMHPANILITAATCGQYVVQV